MKNDETCTHTHICIYIYIYPAINDFCRTMKHRSPRPHPSMTMHFAALPDDELIELGERIMTGDGCLAVGNLFIPTVPHRTSLHGGFFVFFFLKKVDVRKFLNKALSKKADI